VKPFQDIIDFWFVKHGPQDWFAFNAEFDAVIVSQFGEIHAQAMAGELFEWRKQPMGRLAEIIILDQFTRQMYRKTPKAFSADAMALVLAQELVLGKHDKELTLQEKGFAYMPFMHSESIVMHDYALPLFKSISEETFQFAEQHRTLISEFGRYPYRNATLGRSNTSAEDVYLAEKNSSFGQ
jgi:uncharacterized protein (DUF924 family)